MNLHQEETINSYRNLVAEIKAAVGPGNAPLRSVITIIHLLEDFKEPAPVNSISDTNPQPTSPLDE